MSEWPELRHVYAMKFPSGDHAGSLSSAQGVERRSHLLPFVPSGLMTCIPRTPGAPN